jgi:hypothetical protein
MDFSGPQNAWARTHDGINPDIEEAFRYYYSDCGSYCSKLLNTDFEHRYHPSKIHRIKFGFEKDVASFRENGFFMFRDPAYLQGVDIDSLESKAAAAPKDGKPNEAYGASAPLPELDVLANNMRLLELASLYLGDDVQLTHYKLLRLGKEVRAQDYGSGYFHHDGCGSRLKMFIFLQDVVDERDCPTKVAAGSQHTAFWNYGTVYHMRFQDSYVFRQYDVKTMTGRRGEGFIFDTNTVHKGSLQDHHGMRDAIVVDFYSTKKLKEHIPPVGPCPENGQPFQKNFFQFPGFTNETK